MKRRSPPRIANSENKKQKSYADALLDSAANRLGFVLKLGAGQVWAFLVTKEILYLLQACSSGLSKDFIDKMALRALADENKTHLGRQCDCDWMRSLDFRISGLERCRRARPFTVNRAMPSLQAPNGALALLSALALAKRAMLPYFSTTDEQNTAALVPVVCLLATDEERLCNELAVKKAMNRVCKQAGDHFVHNVTARKTQQLWQVGIESIYDHWDSIGPVNCIYCARLVCRQRKLPPHRRWRDEVIDRIRDNCRSFYQPLKAAMKKELQFVRYIPRRRTFPR